MYIYIYIYIGGSESEVKTWDGMSFGSCFSRPVPPHLPRGRLSHGFDSVYVIERCQQLSTHPVPGVKKRSGSTLVQSCVVCFSSSPVFACVYIYIYICMILYNISLTLSMYIHIYIYIYNYIYIYTYAKALPEYPATVNTMTPVERRAFALMQGSHMIL